MKMYKFFMFNFAFEFEAKTKAKLTALELMDEILEELATIQ